MKEEQTISVKKNQHQHKTNIWKELLLYLAIVFHINETSLLLDIKDVALPHMYHERSVIDNKWDYDKWVIGTQNIHSNISNPIIQQFIIVKSSCRNIPVKWPFCWFSNLKLTCWHEYSSCC